MGSEMCIRDSCTIESKESTPLSVLDFTGTPRTGSVVIDAVIPGRWAAPPAPAIIHFNPLDSADRAYSKSKSGVRCALTTFASQGMPNSVRVSVDFSRVGQSDWLPIITPTTGESLLDIYLFDKKARVASKFIHSI